MTSVPSAWLKMEDGLRRFSSAFLLLQILTVAWFFLSLIYFFATRNVELSWIFGLVVLLALGGLRTFSQGAMERLQQLSGLVK